MTDYGVTLAGFVPKKQAVVIAELQARVRATFGNNVNLDDRSVFGQLIGVMSEPVALLWEVLQAVYASAYPSGAGIVGGVSVDNILALNNLRRLAATSSVTNPSPVPRGDGVTLYGLALYGTAGTRVTKGSLIRDTSSPPLSFTLDADVVIQAAVNAQQAIIYSDFPDGGGYILGIKSYRTSSLLSGRVNYDALADHARITFSGPISSGQFYVMVKDTLLGPFTSTDATAIQAAFTGTPWDSSSVFNEDEIVTHPIEMQLAPAPPSRPSFNPTQMDWTGLVATGSYKLVVGGTLTTDAISSINASDVQAALRALGGVYAGVYVHSDLTAKKVWINWGAAVTSPPSLGITSNSTGQVPTIHASNTTGVTFTISDSIRSVLASLFDSDSVRPYSDVVVTSSAGNLFTVEFGGTSPDSGQPASGGLAIPLMQISSNTLVQSAHLVTPQIVQYAEGSPARGVGSATCTAPGPNAVAAGRLTVIGSPTSGWASVSNDLDVIPGTNAETDLQALARRESLLNAQATGPLGSILANVRKVAGVTSATAFQNSTDAALQRIMMVGVPTTGTWQLYVPSVGAFTATLAYGATAADLQAAFNAIAGLEPVLVSGSSATGFTVDFNGAVGAQPQPLLELWNNTTDVDINILFGRPPKSVEVLALGGDPADIARAIYEKLAAGIQAYGAPVQRTTAALTEGNAVVSVTDAVGIAPGQSVTGLGIPLDTTVVGVSGTDITLSGPAMGTYAAAPLIFAWVLPIADSDGNETPVGFTRPTPVLVYVTVALTTDTYRIPGDSTSGVNPKAKFQPTSMAAIQADLLAIGSAVEPGGLIIGRGTGGLIGAFNDVPGVIDYDLKFGLSPSPSANAPIQLQPDQAPIFQLGNIAVSYS